ncbi:hypothetical protein CSC04_2808 [Enterobacter roggenkampii]|nr:hypothetical protein CSC04_2808 [Enterobacter roggenkampii]QLC82964.1 hypothetical protein ED5_2313 [Enterobacter roggenkampii]
MLSFCPLLAITIKIKGKMYRITPVAVVNYSLKPLIKKG